MDEMHVRTMLGELADAEAPPARIDIPRAVSQGRRNRRWRRVAAGGSTLAISAVVGVVVSLVAVPGSGTAGTPHAGAPAGATSTSGTEPAAAPKRFDPLKPYASFGWLPAGYTTGGSFVQLAASTQSVQLGAQAGSSPSATISLTVTVAGACTGSGSPSLPVLSCSYNGSRSGPMRATSAAPRVDGRPAFWAEGQAKDGMLIWEYAPGSWSILLVPSKIPAPPPANEQSVLLQVAANVRYGDTTPIRFPYLFTGVPAGWTVSGTEFTESSGRLLGQSLSLGPAVDPGALGIAIMPAPPGNSCKFVAGQSQYVTLDGVKAVLRTLSEPGKGYQSLCATKVNGLQVYVDLDTTEPTSNTPLPGVAGLGGALGVAKALHLLGTDPANWTTSPLR
jgi:hypothetical protein